MAAVDALFAAILPRARSVLAERMRLAKPVDLDEVTELALAELRTAIDLDDYTPELATRIKAVLKRLVDT